MISSLPLKGKEILITRGAEQAVPFSQYIERLGGVAHAVPLLAFRAYEDKRESVFIKQIDHYDWVVFTSQNAVDFFLKFLRKYSVSFASLNVSIGAVGSKTEEYLSQLGFSVAFRPSRFTAEDFAQEFMELIKRDHNVLIPKGKLASSEIKIRLNTRSQRCDEWIVYETFIPDNSIEEMHSLLSKQTLDVITFTSSSAVRFFLQTLENFQMDVPDLIYACIGPKTKATAEELGLFVQICPNTFTIEEMIKEIIYFYQET
ncbi:uroporphyrinogen-III synthase [Bacillus sp. 2205SS5-2]|uniref:uroporphyrinogen-III synthase n=1 Tax=Bacillus sp. 2205SS5-2 TaxID=3109031 RepID=UPI00300476E7